jgi:hypothetical protein
MILLPQVWPNPLKPMPFPESHGLLLVCCVLYFAISFGLQLLAALHEKDAILYTFAPTATSPCYSPGMNGRRLRVGSSLPRFSVDYTLNIEVLDAEGKLLDKVERVLKLTDYFEEGAPSTRTGSWTTSRTPSSRTTAGAQASACHNGLGGVPWPSRRPCL